MQEKGRLPKTKKKKEESSKKIKAELIKSLALHIFLRAPTEREEDREGRTEKGFICPSPILVVVAAVVNSFVCQGVI